MKIAAIPKPLLVVLAVAAALLFFRLGQPDWTPATPHGGFAKRYVWDESLYAFTTHRYLTGDPGVWRFDASPEDLRKFDSSDIGPHCGYAIHHPPLTAFLMTVSSALLGWSAFAVRVPGAICGLVIVASTWFLAWRLRRDVGIATLAASLVALDGVWFTISRLGIPHVYVAAATCAALVTGLVAWQDEARRVRFTLLTGALCGLGLAFKASAMLPAVLLGAALLARIVLRSAPGTRGRALAAWAVAFLVLPPAVYLASWLPFFLVGHRSWDDFLAMHRHFREWHASMPATMGPSTPWWTWPVTWKPVLLFEEAFPDGSFRRIVARGNPFLWWAAVAAVPWAALRFARRRGAGDAWIVAGYLVAWLPYALVPRFGFSYYMLPAAPCAAAAVATALDDACRAGMNRRVTVFWTSAALAAGAFAASYPSLAALVRDR